MWIAHGDSVENEGCAAAAQAELFSLFFTVLIQNREDFRHRIEAN
jgi:hypothetical protein